MPRILITTNHLREIRGSELVTLELAEEFLLRGWHVDVYTNLFLAPMADRFAALSALGSLRVADDPYDDFGLDYDLIWIQHSLLPPSVIRRLAERGTRTAVAWHHMSAIVDIELPVIADVENLMSDLGTYVSERTRELHRPYGIQGSSLVFPNPVPRRFVEFDHAPGDRPGRIAVVSNHPPQEVLDAAALLDARGIPVDVIGEATGVRDITPELLGEYDAVVTIGKTVQYALSIGSPVYVYDHFGGAGWLGAENLEAEASTNFSGRATGRRIDGEAIAAELVDGYEVARAFAADRRAELRGRFSVERCIDAVLTHPAIVDPAAKRLSGAQSLRWLALSEQLRGMYRTIEFLKDELVRAAQATDAAGASPIEEIADDASAALPDAEPGSVHVFVATTEDPSTAARALASVAQQRLRPDRITTPMHPGLEVHDTAKFDLRESANRFNDLAATVPADFIAVQDGRGSWHPEFLAAAADHLRRHPEQSAVVAPTAQTVERVVNGHRVEVAHHPARRELHGRHDTVDVSDQLVANRTPFAALVFRRTAAVAAGLLDGDLRYAMDWDFGLRLLHVGPIGILDAPSTLVTIHVAEADAAADVDGARARTELAAKAMRLDGARHLMYSAVLTSQAAAANVARSGAITGRLDDLARTIQAQSEGPDEGLEARVRRYLRHLPIRMARRFPMATGVRR